VGVESATVFFWTSFLTAYWDTKSICIATLKGKNTACRVTASHILVIERLMQSLSDSHDMETQTMYKDPESVWHEAKDGMTSESSSKAIKTKGLFSLMELPTELRLKVYPPIVTSKGDEGEFEQGLTDPRFTNTFLSLPQI